MSIDKIVCVGKNYLAHAKELGDAIPDKPVLFLKPPSVIHSISEWGGPASKVAFPLGDPMVQPECEIVLKLGCDGFCMTHEEAGQAIAAVTIGLDMTLRARQTLLKQQGHPWTTAKVFKDAAIVGPWIPYTEFPEYLDTMFGLRINGHLCQSGKGREMTMKPHDLLVYISQFFPLKAGDIIYTGTPAGVTDIAEHTEATVEWGDKVYHILWGN